MIFTNAILVFSTLLPATVLSFQNIEDSLFPARCWPDPCAGITFQNDTYVCGDPRLGPVVPPRKFPLRNELRTYARFGALCPAEFLDKWASDVAPNGTYIYPPANGFVVDTGKHPILGNATLPVGMKLDRFGSEYGSFLAPLGAPYIERSLPPSNLNTFDGMYPYNYHVYQVIKEFVVGLGPIAPWFEQPGMGTQFVTYTNVLGLINEGYLRRLNESEYDEKVEYSNPYTPGPNQ
ncbi:TNT domain-containing protein [Aspergillus fischeri NRRL 181]|uniref:TNT domain-containing protein n=1 Tax=Neosartorya fischeri (strain ATCC 1020 / DSM 3700 / CBS 544.65 / FGSC A1164 / JCM 1740 / NRRL 181 / WB 181) TaxID=331117 RepID=A1DPF8_NEOFI|nr:conserved hypothetical protein [Aspergillus fischeri NRRL 181]EAW16679.1 conserved hypothetical protein [Aspergillus fischeri NRRL 181]KAG2002854.1 hypothetical protein GB937_009390 [Aspergillus fischeri]